MRHHIGKTHRPRRGDVKFLFRKKSYGLNGKDYRHQSEWTSSVKRQTIQAGELPDNIGNEKTHRRIFGSNAAWKTYEKALDYKLATTRFMEKHCGTDADYFGEKIRSVARPKEYRPILNAIHGKGIRVWRYHSLSSSEYHTVFKVSLDGILKRDISVHSVPRYVARNIIGDAALVKTLGRRPYWHYYQKVTYNGVDYQKIDGFWYAIKMVSSLEWNRLRCLTFWPQDRVISLKAMPYFEGVVCPYGMMPISKLQVNGKLSSHLETLVT